jgi:class 3 adenylate cyclase
LRGREQYRLFTNDSNAAARKLYKRAISLDSDYAEPYAGHAETYVQDWFKGDKTALDRAYDLAHQAATRDSSAQGRITGLTEPTFGVATGVVVVGDLVGEGAAREEAVVGDTPNLAARLQSLAEPGSVVVAEETKQLIHDKFELEFLGQFDIKGLDVPVSAWQSTGSCRW